MLTLDSYTFSQDLTTTLPPLMPLRLLGAWCAERDLLQEKQEIIRVKVFFPNSYSRVSNNPTGSIKLRFIWLVKKDTLMMFNRRRNTNSRLLGFLVSIWMLNMWMEWLLLICVLCFKGVILQVLCSLTYQNLSSVMLMMQFTSILPDPGKYAKDWEFLRYVTTK